MESNELTPKTVGEPQPPQLPPPPPESESLSNEAAGMAQAALFIALGSAASRILGFAREIVISNLFGATGLVSAFRVAQIIPTMLYDLLINGMISSALVPVFSEYAEKDRNLLWHIASMMLTLAVIVLTLFVLLIEFFAPQVAFLMAGGLDAELLEVIAGLIRITTPAALFLSLSGIITGLLFALKRFALPAFTAAIFNATIVVVALISVLVFDWGIEALAFGLLLGAFLQIVLQLPGLRDANLRPTFDFKHPALRRIGKLYLPIILGLVISQVAIVLDRNFASRTGEQSIAWMQFATTIIQFALGLVSVAIAQAILPTLSRIAADEKNDLHAFMSTLATGLKLVLVLTIPAAVALFIIADPVIKLAFEHGDFTPFDTQQTVLALRFYLLGLVFAAIDQPLVFAFYARGNTLTPALVGLLGVGFYLIVALLPSFFRPMQMSDLVLANSVQLTGHALVMLWLTHRLVSMRGHGLSLTTLKAVAASAVMGGGLWFALAPIDQWLPPTSLLNEVLHVGSLVAVGGLLYLGGLVLLRVRELNVLLGLFRKLLPKR